MDQRIKEAFCQDEDLFRLSGDVEGIYTISEDMRIVFLTSANQWRLSFPSVVYAKTQPEKELSFPLPQYPDPRGSSSANVHGVLFLSRLLWTCQEKDSEIYDVVFLYHSLPLKNNERKSGKKEKANEKKWRKMEKKFRS